MRLRFVFAVACLVLAVVVGACSNKPAPGGSSAQPGPQAAPAQNGVRVVSGTVQETMNAASYTYVRVRTSEGEIWAATGQFPVAVGDRVRVPLQMAMKDFHSPTLKRDFPQIFFVTEIEREGQSPSQGQAQTAMMPSHGAGGQAPAMGAQPAAQSMPVPAMEPPAGGMRIADVWARRASLAGQTVTVRGKVVKFNGGILDRNWMHIQDGTGDAKDGSNDLTVTSQGGAKVGDVITATGKLAIDKDFGAGYAYKAIVEGATIK